MATGGNAADLRRSNLLGVLQSLRTGSVRSRVELAQDTGLSEPTVYRLIDELVRLGLAHPVPTSTAGGARRGRPIVRFRFASEAGSLIGIDVGGTTVRLLLSDLDGNTTESMHLPTAEIGNDLVAGLHRAVRQLTARAAPLVAVGIGAPSVVSADGALVKPWRRTEWTGLRLAAQLSERLRCAVFVHQDNHLAAKAESSTAGTAAGSTSVVVVELGSGIGAGAVLHGEIQYGEHGGFGRLMGWPCELPERLRHLGSTLGECLTGDGLVAHLRARDPQTRITGAADVFELAAFGDPAAGDTVTWAATSLNRVLRQVALLLDPDHLVVGGVVGRALSQQRPGLVRERVDAVVTPSLLGDRAVAVGGLLTAQEQVDEWLRGCLSDEDPE